MGRVERFMPRMDAMGINYSRSMYQVVPTVENKDGKVYLRLDCEVPTAKIKYALGGVPIIKGSVIQRLLPSKEQLLIMQR